MRISDWSSDVCSSDLLWRAFACCLYSLAVEKKKEKRKKHSNVLFYGAECKYPVIKDLVKEMGWTWVDEGSRQTDNCHLYWIDVANIHERFAKEIGRAPCR